MVKPGIMSVPPDLDPLNSASLEVDWWFLAIISSFVAGVSVKTSQLIYSQGG